MREGSLLKYYQIQNYIKIHLNLAIRDNMRQNSKWVPPEPIIAKAKFMLPNQMYHSCAMIIKSVHI